MKIVLNRSKMISLENYQQKKLGEMSHAPVTQEKNTNTVMDLYNKIIIIDKSKMIALVI